MDSIMKPAVARERVKIEKDLQKRVDALQDVRYIRAAWHLAVHKTLFGKNSKANDPQNDLALLQKSLDKAWTPIVTEDVVCNVLQPAIRSVLGVTKWYRNNDRPDQALGVLLVPSLWQTVVDATTRQDAAHPLHVTAATATKLPKALPPAVLKSTNTMVSQWMLDVIWNVTADDSEFVQDIILPHVHEMTLRAHAKALEFSAARADFLVKAAVMPVAHTFSMAAPTNLSQYAPDVYMDLTHQLRQDSNQRSEELADALAHATRTACRKWMQDDPTADSMMTRDVPRMVQEALQQQEPPTKRGLFSRFRK